MCLKYVRTYSILEVVVSAGLTSPIVIRTTTV